MAEASRTPVSNDLRLAVFTNFKKRKHPKVLSFEIGTKPGEIIFFTTAGRVPCLVTEDENFIYLEMASGTQDRRTPKGEFLKEIGFIRQAV